MFHTVAMCGGVRGMQEYSFAWLIFGDCLFVNGCCTFWFSRTPVFLVYHFLPLIFVFKFNPKSEEVMIKREFSFWVYVCSYHRKQGVPLKFLSYLLSVA